MKNKITCLSVICVYFLLSGCSFQGSSQGNGVIGKSNKAEIYKVINDNITTKSDARKFLGDPSDIDYYEVSKQEKWIYMHVNKSNLLRNYVPIFNFFTRGTEDVQKKVILIFNSEGILAKSFVSESVAENKNGMFD